MTVPANDPAPRATLMMLWLSMSAAPIVYVVVAYALRPSAEFLPRFAELTGPVPLGLTVAAASSAVAGLVMPRFLVARARATVSDPRTLSDDDRARLLRGPLTVRYAMFDAVAVCGFVTVFLGASAATSIPFAALALALLLTHPPTSDRLADLLGD